MFRESLPIAYDVPADLKKWPSLTTSGCQQGAVSGLQRHLADCIRQLLAKPIKQISLYDIVTERQPAFDGSVLSPGDAAEIAMRKDFPKTNARLSAPCWRTGLGDKVRFVLTQLKSVRPCSRTDNPVAWKTFYSAWPNPVAGLKNERKLNELLNSLSATGEHIVL